MMEFHTFGCKVNTYDTGLLQGRLTPIESAQPVHILNTCAVTSEATKEAVRLIRQLKAKNPLSTVVVTGCAAQVDTDSFSDLKGADLVVANSHKGELQSLLNQYFKGELKERVFKSNIFKKEDLEEGGGVESSHTRSFLKIQDGCNSFCTFCVIPFARGKSRSLSISNLISRVNELYSQGVREVVLTGVHIGDYQDETLKEENFLEDLIERLLKKTLMPRFRLTSLEPIEVSERLLNLFKNPRLCPHFHMSIQSASTDVLKNMKRKYGANEVSDSLKKIYELLPHAYVGMDVIAGFPTETEEHFLETYQNLSQLPWTRLHVFPYSERPGTKAVAFTSVVHQNERSQRAKRLRELSAERLQSHGAKQVGSIKKVLILKDGNRGLSRDYWNIKILNSESKSLNERDVRVLKYENESTLIGELL